MTKKRLLLSLAVTLCSVFAWGRTSPADAGISSIVDSASALGTGFGLAVLYLLLLSIAMPILFAVLGYDAAKRKNREGGLWAFICFQSGVLGLSVLACSKPLQYYDALGITDSDSLGWTMFAITILPFLIYSYFIGMAIKFFTQNPELLEQLSKAL